MDYLRSDCILREILEEQKSLTGFLDAVFGFMSRNTDFFHIQKTKEDKLGFPRGVKEQILMGCMQKYEKDFEAGKLKEDLIIDDPPLAIEEVEIVDDATQPTEEGETIVSTVHDMEMLESFKSVDSSMKCVNFNESDYKNGAVFENYCWSQTLKDVELNVLLPNEIKSSKHVKLDLKMNQISVKSLSPKEDVIIFGQTWDKYRHNDVVWTISDGKLILSFDKFKDCWWDKLFTHESPIDITKLDTERPLKEYSPETQSAIEQLQSGNTQPDVFKTLPLSQSEQMSRLQQAWNAEGSPFKGQPFNPSVIKFD